MPKFLILRFSSIGDIVLTTPVIRCLKLQVIDAEVHYATRNVYSEILEHNPYIDKKFFLVTDLSLLIHELKKEKYDYIIDLHHNLRTFLIKSRLGVNPFLPWRNSPKAVSFNKLNFEKWMMVNFKINRLPPVHIVDRYMANIKQWGVANDGLGLDYFLSVKEETVVQQLPASHQNGYIGFVIGARHFTKQLPVEKIISVCKKLNQPIVLLGGKEDHEKGDAIISELNSKAEIQRPKIYNGCGKFSINQSAALVKHASKIITHDTGLMHVAAAFKKEIIGIWGNTIPEFGMTPYYGNLQVKNKRFEIQHLPCRPCTKIGFNKCPKKHFKCMMEMDEQMISDAAAL